MANFNEFKLATRVVNGKDSSTALTATRHSFFYVHFLLGLLGVQKFIASPLQTRKMS